MHLAAIHLHPLKSSAAIAVDAAVVEPRGLRHDRRWLAVDAGGRFVTGRELARLTLIRATPVDEGLVLEAPGMPRLRVVARTDAERIPVVVWNSSLHAPAMGVEADAWLSAFIGRPLRLVHMDDAARRAITSSRAEEGDEVSFADAFPVLLVSQASLDGLNARLASPVSMSRFRPNLVIDGAAAHAEDGWSKLRIGDVAFDVAKPCIRCVFTTSTRCSGSATPAASRCARSSATGARPTASPSGSCWCRVHPARCVAAIASKSWPSRSPALFRPLARDAVAAHVVRERGLAVELGIQQAGLRGAVKAASQAAVPRRGRG